MDSVKCKIISKKRLTSSMCSLRSLVLQKKDTEKRKFFIFIVRESWSKGNAGLANLSINRDISITSNEVVDKFARSKRKLDFVL